MITDSLTYDDTGSTSVPADVTDDYCTVQFIEIVPLTRDTDDPCTTECDSGDWSNDVKQEYLPVVIVKQEPYDVSSVLFRKCLKRCTKDEGCMFCEVRWLSHTAAVWLISKLPTRRK